jgi:Fe-S cluster assembly protein SufD
MTSQIAISLYDQLVDEFESLNASSEEGESLQLLRATAFEAFKKQGFPTIKNEDWKYTNIVPFLKENFELEGLVTTEGRLITDVIKEASIPSLDSYKIVLINGRLADSLSDIPQIKGLKLQALSSVKNDTRLHHYLEKNIDVSKNAFAALNTAMFNDGLFIEVERGKFIEKPVHVIHVFTSDKNLFVQPRHLFIARQGSSFQLIESVVNADGDSAMFVNSVTNVILEQDAQFDNCFINSGKKGKRYIHETQVSQGFQSLYNNYNFSLPEADLIRNNLTVVLEDKHTESHMYGLYLASDKQLIDNHSLVDHRMPDCNSNELYKGVLFGNSKAVFNGKIFVREDAQKTNAFQQNNNLLLSDKAVIDSKPQLEIYADDVKCSHGATVGSFNSEALFYLRSRGIGENTARALLVNAFAFDVTDQIKNEHVKAHVQKLIRKFLANLYA